MKYFELEGALEVRVVQAHILQTKKVKPKGVMSFVQGYAAN